jgi:hypothetical protein
MATFIATTASSRPRLTDREAAQDVLDRYHWDSDVTAAIEVDHDGRQAYLAINAYDWPGAYKIPDGIDPDDFEPEDDADPVAGFENFLRDIALYLAEPLTVQGIGAEKCRFPLAACEWHIKPGGTQIHVTCFNAIDDEPLPESSADSPAVNSTSDANRQRHQT